jgi:hypothetical protein
MVLRAGVLAGAAAGLWVFVRLGGTDPMHSMAVVFWVMAGALAGLIVGGLLASFVGHVFRPRPRDD